MTRRFKKLPGMRPSVFVTVTRRFEQLLNRRVECLLGSMKHERVLTRRHEQALPFTCQDHTNLIIDTETCVIAVRCMGEASYETSSKCCSEEPYKDHKSALPLDSQGNFR